MMTGGELIVDIIVVTLGDAPESDPGVFFEMGCDPVAIEMATFVPEIHGDSDSFFNIWALTLAEQRVINRMIQVNNGFVVGDISCFEMVGKPP